MKNLVALKLNWDEKKLRLKRKFSILTDSDVLWINGKEDQLMRHLQARLGRSQEELYVLLANI